jgi:hypothetical protein
MCDVPGIGTWNQEVLSMNCQRNVISILPTQFSYIVVRFIHNYFESPNIYISIYCKIDVQVNNPIGLIPNFTISCQITFVHVGK